MKNNWKNLIEQEEEDIEIKATEDDSPLVDDENLIDQGDDVFIKQPEFKFEVRGTNFTLKELENIVESYEGVGISEFYIMMKSDSDLTNEQYISFYEYIEDQMYQLKYKG